jgi:hypothetical protein
MLYMHLLLRTKQVYLAIHQSAAGANQICVNAMDISVPTLIRQTKQDMCYGVR